MNYFPVGKKVKKQKFMTMVDPFNVLFDSVDAWYWSSSGNTPNAAVVYNNEIHILGGGSSAVKEQYHYKWNQLSDTWESVSTLPFRFAGSSAVVLNDEIHLLGSSNHDQTKHYKWDGETWTEVSTIPFNVYYSVAVVLNGEIHLIGGLNTGVHYKWDGETWTYIDSLPASDNSARAAVISDGEIHVLSGTKHYKWNGETWTEVGALPTNVTMKYKMAVEMDELIYIFCSPDANSNIYVYNRNNNDWKRVYYNKNLGNFSGSSCNVVFHGLHVINGTSDSTIYHYCNLGRRYVPIV